jgi:hypothetical protein
MKPGIVPESGEGLDPGRSFLGTDQRSDNVLQGIAAVEDRQMRPIAAPGLLPDQFDGQFSLGPEWLVRAGGLGPLGQLQLAKVESAGDRQIPGRPVFVLEQEAEGDPVIGPDGGGPVGAAGGVFVEGAGPPDMLPRAMDLTDVVWGNTDFGVAPYAPIAWAKDHGVKPAEAARLFIEIVLQDALAFESRALVLDPGRDGTADGLRKSLQRLLHCPEFQLA